MDVELIELAAAFVVVAFAAAAQGTVGMGFNILAVPVMSLINPVLAPVPQLILSLPLTISSVARERAGVDRSGVFWILMGRLPGAVIGVWLLSIATDRSLDLFIGLMVLGAVIMLASGIRLVRTRSVEFATGVFAGISSYVATIGGPPVALLYSKDEGAMVRSTLGLIFLIGSSITLLARTLAGDITGGDVVIGLSLFPAAVLGFALSSRLKERVTPGHLRMAILALSSIAAIALLSRAIWR